MSSRTGSKKSSRTGSKQSHRSETSSRSGSEGSSRRKDTSNSGQSADIEKSPNGDRNRLKRGCSFQGSYRISGKKMMRERFLNDAQLENNRKKKAKQDMRSNGVKYKCESLLRFSEASDFKVSATFLPSWDRGVPHVILSQNWDNKDRPMRPAIKKQYVKNWNNIQVFFDEEDEPSTSGHPSTSGDTNKRGAMIGSPNVARPLAASKPKKKLVPEIKCTICNATYEKNTSKMWMFCGAAGKRKCTKLAIHSDCHFVVAKDQKDVDELCKKYIRCFDCRKKEKEVARREREAAQKEKDAAQKEREAARREREAAQKEKDAAQKEREAAKKLLNEAKKKSDGAQTFGRESDDDFY